MKELQEKFESEEQEWPHYSTGLELCDFHEFGPLKEALAKWHYHTDAEVQNCNEGMEHPVSSHANTLKYKGITSQKTQTDHIAVNKTWRNSLLDTRF